MTGIFTINHRQEGIKSWGLMLLLTLGTSACHEKFYDMEAPGRDGGVDAGGDTHADSEDVAVDGQSDSQGDVELFDVSDSGEDVGTLPIGCSWAFPQHRMVQSLEDQIGGGRNFWKVLLKPNGVTTRIVAQTNDSTGFFVHTVAPISSDDRSTKVETGASIASIQRLSPTKLGLFTINWAEGNESFGHGVFRSLIDDLDPLGVPIADVQLTNNNCCSILPDDIHILPGAGEGQFHLVARFYKDNAFGVFVGQYEGERIELSQVYKAQEEKEVRIKDVVDMGLEAMIWVGDMPRLIYFSKHSHQVTNRDISKADEPKQLLAIATNDSGGLRIAAASTTNLYVGNVEKSKVHTFTLSDLPEALSTIEHSDVPNGNIAWSSDQLVTFGESRVAKDRIMGLWLDSRGFVRYKRVIENFLGKRIERVIFETREPLHFDGGSIDLAWVESIDGYEVLYFNRLFCMIV